MEKEIQVKDYDKLVHKMAWKYSNKWNIDESNMYSEGLYIFVLTLNKFEKERGHKFVTYLYHQLQGKLDKYGRRETHQVHRYIPWDDVYFKEFPNGWYNSFVKNLEFYETILTELSEDAQNVLSMILRSLENTYKRKPSLYGTTKYFRLFRNWNPLRTKKAWEEIKSWWMELNLTSLSV